MTGSFPPRFQASPLPAAHAACLVLLFLCVSCLSLVLRDGDQTPHPTLHNRLCVMQVSRPVCTQEDGNFCSHDSQPLTSNTGSQQTAHGPTRPHCSETHLPGAWPRALPGRRGMPSARMTTATPHPSCQLGLCRAPWLCDRLEAYFCLFEVELTF